MSLGSQWYCYSYWYSGLSTVRAQDSQNNNASLTMNNVITMNQFSSVTQLCLTLCDPVDCSTPGFSVHDQPWRLLNFMSIKLMMHLLIAMNSLLFFLQITLLLNKVTWNSPSADSYNQLSVKLGSFVLFHFWFIETAFLYLVLLYNYIENLLHDSKIKSVKQIILKEV